MEHILYGSVIQLKKTVFLFKIISSWEIQQHYRISKIII